MRVSVVEYIALLCVVNAALHKQLPLLLAIVTLLGPQQGYAGLEVQHVLVICAQHALEGLLERLDEGGGKLLLFFGVQARLNPAFEHRLASLLDRQHEVDVAHGLHVPKGRLQVPGNLPHYVEETEQIFLVIHHLVQP